MTGSPYWKKEASRRQETAQPTRALQGVRDGRRTELWRRKDRRRRRVDNERPLRKKALYVYACEIPYRAQTASWILRSLVYTDASESLMLRFRSGDVRAFEILLQRHRQSIYEFVLRSVGTYNTAQAEDLTQETFLRVVKQAGSYEPRSKFTTWLFTLARNLCIDASRRRKHRKAQSLDAPDEEGHSLLDRTSDGGMPVDRQAVSTELRARLERAIEELPEDQREVFLMRESADLSFKEIADVIGISENTVKSRMRYALEKLRASLDEYQDMARALP